MFRRKENPKTGKRVFKKTSNGTHIKNTLLRGVPRGGIRL